MTHSTRSVSTSRLVRTLLAIAMVAVSLARPDAQRSRTATTPALGTAVGRLRIGLDATPKATTRYELSDWADSIRLMRTTGANHFQYGRVWSLIETSPGVYDTENVQFMVAQSAPLPIAFTLRLIDAGNRNMPAAYRGLAWDSPDMVAHVANVIDAIAPILGTRPWSYAIGNEIDLYFATRRSEIAAYARMLSAVKARVKAHHPGAAFTTVFQFAAVQQLRTLYAPIVNTLDQVAFTYYPVAADFSVRAESAITSDLQTMIAAAAPRRVFLQEIGCPTSALLGSSEEWQRAFVQIAGETIRSVGPARVAGATYLFQEDLPQWIVDLITIAYGNSSERFRQFVSTLGLRDDRDRPKLAWQEFVRQAKLIAPPR